MPQRVRKRGSVRLPPKPGGKNKRSNPLPIETARAMNEAVASAAMGQPTSYRPEFDEAARRFYILGYDDKDFAEYLGVSEDTIKEWASVHASFSHIRAHSKTDGDMEVEASLRSRALGYSHPAVKIQLGPGGQVIETEYIQHYPPDPKSAELWLFNRHRKEGRWRDPRFDKPEENGGGISIKIVGGLPEDEPPKK